jgi:prepilin-type N-terminal cleavage/methylation domain-containing protein
VPRSKPDQRGLTLFEILITLSIIALISSAIAFGVSKYFVWAQRRAAEIDARNLLVAAKLWRMENPDHCPTFQELVESGHVESGTRQADPWKTPYRMACVDNRISVSSAGPDRQSDTEDDIRVPPPD